jgi:ABC-type transport system substrate-binding protein
VRRALVVLAAILAACGRSAPEDRYVLRVGVTKPLLWEGPKTQSGGAMAATDLVYESLLVPSGDGLTSQFLRRWERTRDGRWRLEFKPGARFSDGRPVTAEDLARSLRVRDFRVVVDGDVLLAEPGAGSGGLGDLMLMPVANGEGAGALGTGPFALVEQGPGRLRLRRLEHRPGGIDAVELVGLDSPREAFSLLLRGKLNAVSPLDRAQAELLEGIPGLRLAAIIGPNATVAFLNPKRLSREERRALAEAVPVAEVAALAGLGAHCQGPAPRRALPGGRPLRIGYLALWEETRRAALGLRRALGTRGGEVVPVTQDKGRVAPADLDLLVKPALVWPSASLAVALSSGSRFNPFGYANPAFDDAVTWGDDAAAAAELQEDPAMIVICRRERLMAVDARLRNATPSAWGIFDGLPEWEVDP